ncbi:monocarboxylate transporter 12 [Anabrus simplex]|uniref:monocarboxylate transporter 12 n=1 Tax=Anabrus simplex TaxID=316456 RepID=UPI0034DCF732
MTHAPPAKRRQVDGELENEREEECSLQPTPPDGGWGWVVVFASFMIHIVTDGVTYSFGVFFSEFLRYFESGNGETAFIASILVGVTLCSGPITSSFVNRFGCRPVTIAGAVLASFCLGISVLAPNVLTLYFTIGLGTGFGFGLIYLPAIVSVTCYFEKYRSLATGIAVCGSGLGTFVLAPLTELLIDRLKWQHAMLIVALLVLSCVLFGALFRPLEARETEEGVIQMEVLPSGTSTVEATLPPEKSNLLTSKKESSSEHNLQSVVTANGTKIHRPHSIGQLAVPRPQSSARLALSQPILMSTSGDHKTSFDSHSLRRKSSGIMYRRDIFYRASLHNIPYHHKSAQWMSHDSSHPEQVPLQPNGVLSIPSAEQVKNVVMCGCVPCSPETADTLREMLDFSLLKDPVFILFTISNFFTSVGFNVPYVYLAVQAETRGIEKDHASYLLAIIGIANTVGRIILGYVSDKPWINRLLIYNLCLTVCGIATAFSALCSNFYAFAVYGSVFGFTIGAYVGLTSVILVDLLGLEKLTNAFGLLLLFQGIASLIGPPIAGILYDALKSYDPGFVVAGVMMAVSGVMLFIIPPVQRRIAQKARGSQLATVVIAPH